MLEHLQLMREGFTDIKDIADSLQYVDYTNQNYVYEETMTTPDLAWRYQGDLYGLFGAMGIESKDFIFTMYINGYTNPTNYDGLRTTFKLAPKPNIPT
jgi:hypothetical protein